MASKCEYQPIVRHPERGKGDEEEVHDKISTKAVKEYYGPPYTKVKLMLSNNENELPFFRRIGKKNGGTEEINSTEQLQRSHRPYSVLDKTPYGR